MTLTLIGSSAFPRLEARHSIILCSPVLIKRYSMTDRVAWMTRPSQLASRKPSLIVSLPASGYYLPHSITQTEEAYLVQKVIALGFNFP